ncbi:MAG: prenyltransferase [Coriobacteriia bacterium]|nr:prenyltransferase [Coriobacteriia bacterium]
MKSTWFLETRPQFLLLSVVLVLHGSALAYWQGSFDWVAFVLSMIGLVLLHASVNVLNDWHDYKTGIDLETQRTPFSGGSGMLPGGAMKPGAVLALGLGCLVVGCAIGFYLVYVSGWPLLVIGGIGAFSVVTYAPLLTRIGVGEIFAGLGLGYLPVLGVYYVHTGALDAAAWVSAIPAGFLTYNLLFLNEFPDMEADAAGGRRHMVILLGKAKARFLYSAVELGTYVAIVVGVVMGVLTPWALLGLGATVLAFKAIRGAMVDYESFEALIPAQGANVMAVLATNALLAVGYLVAGLL